MFVNEKHLNSGKFAHGGFLMSFLDNVMGNAAYKSFGNKPCVTISMNTHFTFSAQKGDELIGLPTIERMTKTLCFVNCKVFSKNEIIVSGSGIWKLVKTSSIKSVKDNTYDQIFVDLNDDQFCIDLAAKNMSSLERILKPKGVITAQVGSQDKKPKQVENWLNVFNKNFGNTKLSRVYIPSFDCSWNFSSSINH